MGGVLVSPHRGDGWQDAVTDDVSCRDVWCWKGDFVVVQVTVVCFIVDQESGVNFLVGNTDSVGQRAPDVGGHVVSTQVVKVPVGFGRGDLGVVVVEGVVGSTL